MNEIILASALTILSPNFCLPMSVIDDSLKVQYKEEPQPPIKIDDTMALQFYRGPKSWTLVLIKSDGESCVIAAGEGWELTKS